MVPAIGVQNSLECLARKKGKKTPLTAHDFRPNPHTYPNSQLNLFAKFFFDWVIIKWGAFFLPFFAREAFQTVLHTPIGGFRLVSFRIRSIGNKAGFYPPPSCNLGDDMTESLSSDSRVLVRQGSSSFKL